MGSCMHTQCQHATSILHGLTCAHYIDNGCTHAQPPPSPPAISTQKTLGPESGGSVRVADQHVQTTEGTPCRALHGPAWPPGHTSTLDTPPCQPPCPPWLSGGSVCLHADPRSQATWGTLTMALHCPQATHSLDPLPPMQPPHSAAGIALNQLL